MKKVVLLMLTLAFGLMACGSSQSANEAGQVRTLKLPMGYIPNIQYAPFYVAVDKGYFAEEGIAIEFDYAFETDGMKLVGAGELPFAVASGEQVLLARAQGLPVVYAFAWYQQFPISVIAKSELNIKEPADLRGKKIGLPGLFGANYIGVEALLFSAGVDPSEVTFDAIGFNQVESFATGKSDVVVGYTANEPIVLRSQGMEVSELRVADYVQMIANGIVTSEATIVNKPDLVGSMTRAFSRGLADTIANPDEAYTISLKYVENLIDQDKAVQMQILNTSIEYWKADRIGYSDPQAWQNMNDLLVKMALLSEPMDLGKAFTNEFVP
ncbi:MAG TPA: ABC transporter substrate-binding protein [Anaerolineales bacterium]|nr:ABC transporter substrate-binding protein [Anaerolineales bacterium]HNN14033.1 ABC transporter substrate-binding protein [Anaerolineales bacterium]HNO30819.1 ABC transporter substrate-binding protein [Anaerolineales bacterium]